MVSISPCCSFSVLSFSGSSRLQHVLLLFLRALFDRLGGSLTAADARDVSTLATCLGDFLHSEALQAPVVHHASLVLHGVLACVTGSSVSPAVAGDGSRRTAPAFPAAVLPLWLHGARDARFTGDVAAVSLVGAAAEAPLPAEDSDGSEVADSEAPSDDDSQSGDAIGPGADAFEERLEDRIEPVGVAYGHGGSTRGNAAPTARAWAQVPASAPEWPPARPSLGDPAVAAPRPSIRGMMRRMSIDDE